MGRKNRTMRSRSVKRSKRESRVNSRFERHEIDTFEYRESSYQYGDRVKPQRYPQPAKNISMRTRITPKNFSQEVYLSALQDREFVVGMGAAGSGKTFLAIAVAIEKLLKGEVEKIIITRPIVEAGDPMGFLPGTLEQKILPYLMPLLDAVEQCVGKAGAEALVESGQIVFAPLAYMRGSSYRNCIMILDEAQNTTITQMKLFVTRPGEGSSIIITGDPVQSDLKERGYMGQTGLEWAASKFGGGRSSRIEVVEFANRDTVRSELLKEILTLIDAPDLQTLLAPRPKQRPVLA